MEKSYTRLKNYATILKSNGKTMTPTKLMWYYKQNKSLAARDIGCSRATISNWIKAKKIPKHWQSFIAWHWELSGKK